MSFGNFVSAYLSVKNVEQGSIENGDSCLWGTPRLLKVEELALNKIIIMLLLMMLMIMMMMMMINVIMMIMMHLAVSSNMLAAVGAIEELPVEQLDGDHSKYELDKLGKPH